MKKTLVALAVLAASGASFAQVTITGGYNFGYRVSTDAAANLASGLGIDTATITFADKEDLGGGASIGASINIDTIARAGVAGGDTSLTYSSGAGTVSLSSARGGDYLNGYTGGVSWDGKITSALTASDAISYTSPVFAGGLTVSLSHAEAAVTQAGETAAVGPIGLGVGGAGATGAVAGYQRVNGISLSYSAGALRANLGLQVYDQADVANNDLGKNRVSVAAQYDLGAAKIGGGFRNLVLNTGTRQDYAFGVVVPLNAFTVSANVASRKWADLAAGSVNTAGSKTGQSLKGEYALSKRTSVSASYARWDNTVGAANASTETNILLNHSF